MPEPARLGQPAQTGETAPMTKRPLHIDMADLRRMHGERMQTWGLPSDDDYETEVVNRVIDWHRGVAPEPFSHSHAIEEMGMCVDCDAAALIARLTEGD